MTGLIREHIFSDPGPSCIGFEEKNEEILPILESEEKEYQDLFIINLIQRGSLDFIDDYLEKFSAYIDYLPFKSHEVSLSFEGMLINSKNNDRKIFNSSYFEDLVYGARDKINIYNFITEEINNVKNNGYGCLNESYMDYSTMVQSILWGRSKVTKFIVYAIFDRKTLKEKVKCKLKNHRVVFKVCKRGYKVLKKLKV